MIRTIARARGYGWVLAVVLVCCLVSWSASGLPIDLPVADGPRVLRQYLIAFLPGLLAPVLLDSFPIFSGTLARVSLLRAVDVVGYWSALAVVLLPGWRGVSAHVAQYEVLVTLVVASAVMVVTRRWGIHGALLGAVLGMIWVLAGDTIATVAGFPAVAYRQSGPDFGPTAQGTTLLVGASLAAIASSVLAARPHPR